MFNPLAARNLPRPPRPDLNIGNAMPREPGFREKLHLGPVNVTIIVHPGRDREHGLEVHRSSNLIPLTGRQIVRDLLANSGPAPSSVGIGTDNSATLDSTVTLGAEVFRGFVTRRTSSPSRVTYEFYLADTEANGQLLQEAGLFAQEAYSLGQISPAGGFLFARAVHTPVQKDITVSVTYVWEIPISSS